MLLLKKINNNVAVAASDDGKELVVFGKGIGFGDMPRVLEDESAIERKFFNVPEQLYEVIVSVSQELLFAASDIANYAAEQLGATLSPGLPFILADHLQFALDRDDTEFYAPNPLAKEVASVYPRELEIGYHGLDIVEAQLGVRLPAAEATSFALHIVNAEIDGAGRAKDIDFVMKSTRVADRATTIVEDQLAITVDRTSYAYNRFLAHLRFLLRRMLKGAETETENLSLFYQAARDFPDVYNCAIRINDYLRHEFNQMCSDEELLYIMMHINRLKSEAGEARVKGDASPGGDTSSAGSTS